MATAREQRMQERMRGAGRHQVEDVSFGFDLPAAEPPAPEASQPIQRPRSTPNTAVKRSRPGTDGASKTAGALDAAAPTALTSTAKRKRDIYDIPDDTSEERVRPRGPPSAKGPAGRLSAVRIPGEGHSDVAISATQLESRLQPRGAMNDPIVSEEVAESPIEAPGSGQRRSVRLSEVEESARRLQSVLGSEHDVTLPASSPSLRKTVGARGQARQSMPRRSMRGTRNSLEQKAVVDELSPDVRPSVLQSAGAISSSRNENDVDELSPVPVSRKPKARPKSVLGPGRKREGRQEKAKSVQEPKHGWQTVDGDEEAGRPVRRRPRPSSPLASVDLSSQPLELSSMPQRQHRRDLDSPAQQRQPKKRKAVKPPGKSTAVKETPTGSAPEATGFHVNVQRFTRKPHVSEDEEGSGPDVLQLDIPFANRSGVNSVDLLAQLCEDIISTQRDVLQNKAANAEDRARKREFVTMLKALEAFRTELSTRLLEHTIALDTVYALNKRVKAAQKEKVALREEILRLRAEREQVAIRMDAVRLKHEHESESALHTLELSVAMHNIDLAVEQGAVAGPLTASARKAAGLANLEIAISRIADLASSKSEVGGTLRQAKEFNGFLERAALALEAR